MPQKKLLVYDDEEHAAEIYVRTLRRLPAVNRNFTVDTVVNLSEAVDALTARQKAFRRSGDWDAPESLFDEASILIIDYDLLRQKNETLTGEHLSYLIRCFSKCKVILGLNQFADNTFDLTLKGHPESFADLNVDGRQLRNANLWGGNRSGFRPWHWPHLPTYLADFDKKCDDVSLNIERPISHLLGIPEDVMKFLPRSVAEFLGKEPEKVTCKQFVMQSGNGLRRKDAKKRKIPEPMLARIAAARISKWLERLVLPGQDILVDGPHLVSRFPSLLTQAEKIASWQRTAALGESHKKLGIRWKVIEDFRFKKDYWVSRPVWFWRDLCSAEDLSIREIKEPWVTELPDWVFCEDASRFLKKAKCREFVASTESPYARRFAKVFRGVDYQPTVRFSY